MVGGSTAMAKTVGLTAAAGCELVLSGGLSGGVHQPVAKSVYGPVLEMLEKEGLIFEEDSSIVSRS